MKVTIEDTFMEGTMEPIFRVRRDDGAENLMVACIHYSPNKADKVRISRPQALRIAREIKKAVSE